MWLSGSTPQSQIFVASRCATYPKTERRSSLTFKCDRLNASPPPPMLSHRAMFTMRVVNQCFRLERAEQDAARHSPDRRRSSNNNMWRTTTRLVAGYKSNIPFKNLHQAIRVICFVRSNMLTKSNFSCTIVWHHTILYRIILYRNVSYHIIQHRSVSCPTVILKLLSLVVTSCHFFLRYISSYDISYRIASCIVDPLLPNLIISCHVVS